MSGILEQHIAALNRHSEALEKFVAATAKSGAGAATGGSAGASTGGTASTGTKNKAAGPTLQDIQDKFGEYMSIQDKTVRATRKGHVLNIAGKFGADRATNIPPAHFKEALELLAAYEAGKDPFASEGDAGEEESPI
jgi:hypothetical protein